MNEARAFLLSLIKDKSSSQRIVELSYKIILLIGIARSNVEDLLLVASLLQNNDFKVDLRLELRRLKTDSGAEKVKTTVDYSVRETTKKGTIFYLKAEGKPITSSDAFACDS